MKFYTIRAAKSSDSAKIHIYGTIGESWWDDESITARQFVKDINALDVSSITIRINSIGGSVADGIAIYNAIKRHKATVTVAIDSVAFSIASLIAMAGDTVEMAENALMMIHAPWAYASGNSAAMRKTADILDKFAEAMSSSYAGKTGKTHDDVMAWLTDGDDHYFTAAEALSENLVDAVVDALPIAASFDLSMFKTLPAAAGIFHKPAKQEASMPQTQKPAATENPIAAQNQTHIDIEPSANADEIRAAALRDEQQRRTAIRARFEPLAKKYPSAGLTDVMNACLDDPAINMAAAVEKMMDQLGKDTTPVAGNFHHRIEVGETEQDKFKAGALSALLVRAGAASKDQVKADASNNFRGYTLLEMARASLHMLGVNTGAMDKMTVVAAAFTHSNSDFTNLLANVAEKSMMMGYDEAEETFQTWTMRGTASDFKPIKRVDLNTFPALSKVAEGAEYSYGTIGDRGETVQLATYGKMFSITRQAVINDDLRAFTMIPRRMGRAAIRTIGDLVYAVLTGNPTMSDAVALFHATHNNLLTGAGVNTTSVDAMRVAMAKQKDAGNNAAALNIRLAHLIVPMALEGIAKVTAESEYEVGASARNNTIPNSVRGTFNVVSDARLDAASATAWYGAASPGMHDTVEVTYLDGQESPVLESKDGWTVDGAEFKVRIDAAVSPLDFRTLAKNPGA